MSLREGLKLFDDREFVGNSEGFLLCMRALRRLSSAVTRSFDLEQQLVNTYKTAVSRGSAFQLRPERPRSEDNTSLNELKYLYEQEVKKVGRLTEKLEEIQESFKELEEYVNDLTEERERLTEEIARHQGEPPNLTLLTQQLKELESSMRKECSKCAERKDKIRGLKKHMNELSEENSDLQTNLALADQKIDFLTSQADAVAVEFEKYRKMHDDLKKEYDSVLSRLSDRNLQTQSSIQFSPHADDDISHLAKENADMSVRMENLEDELERRQGELLRLAEVRKLLEVTNSDLIRRLEAEQNKVNHLRGLTEEYEEESQELKAKLSKAQSLIKQLNDECEHSIRELKNAEDSEERLKKDNRILERTNVDLQRQMQEVTLMKKTEERLRGEIANLKQNLNDLAAQKDEEVSEYSHAIVQLQNEKEGLEGGIEELELKLEEIERQSAARDNDIRAQEGEIIELRGELLKREEQLKKMTEDLEQREAEREEEVISMKRHAENVMRQMQSFQGVPEEDHSVAMYSKLNRSRGEEGGRGRVSTMKRSSPSRSRSKPSRSEDKENISMDVSKPVIGVEGEKLVVSPIAMQNLALQLEEALVRERDLKLQLQALIEREAAFLKAKLEKLEGFEVALKPELERWIMRNEELEQRLIDLTDKNSRLLRLLSDCQKTIMIKNKQMAESKKCADELKESLAEALEIRGVELLDRQGLLQKEVLPKSEQIAADQTSLAQAASIKFREEIEQHRANQREMDGFLEQERNRVRELLNEVGDLRGVCTVAKLDREAIERQLRSPTAGGVLEGVSREAKAIISWIIDLQRFEEALRKEQDLRNDLQNSHNQLKSAYRDLEASSSQSLNNSRMLLEAREDEWLKERRTLLDQIEDIREAAISDRLTKQKELESLEEAIDRLKESSIDLEQQLTSAEADNAALRQRLDKTIEECAKDRESYSQEIQELNHKLDSSGLEVGKLSSSLVKTERELVLVREELSLSKTKYRDDLTRTLDENSERMRVKDRAIQQLKEDNDAVLKEKQQLQEQVSVYGREASELRKTLLDRSLVGNDYNLQTMKRELDRTRTELDRAHSELAVAKREVRDYETPDMKREVHRGESERGYYNTKPADLTRTREDSEGFIRHLEHMIEQKNTVISDLEHQLQTIRLELTKSFRSASGSLRNFMGGEEIREDEYGSDYTRTIEHLESTVEKLQRKKDTDKRSFQKRVKEFELILRYLEEKINEATEYRTRIVISDEKMYALVGDLAQKNPTLNTWLRVLSNKLDTFCQSAQMQLFREKRTYSEIVTLLLDNSPLYVELGELAGLYNDLTGVNARVDLDSASKRLLIHLTKYIGERDTGNHRRMLSGSSQRT